MYEPILALAIILAVFAVVWTWLAWRRRRAMRRPAIDLLTNFGAGDCALVLAFTTDDCAPCKTVQHPALEALEQLYPGRLVYREVDAVRSSDLVQRFGILTVPSTVVIGPGGEVRAINHGTATAERLATQVDLNGRRSSSG